MKFILIIIITMSAMGHTKTIEMKIPQENKKECLKFAKTFELKLPIAGIVMSMKSRCEPKIVWVKVKVSNDQGLHLGELALDLGQTESWVQQALGHAFDSKVTRKYMRVREGTMLDVFNKIGKRA